MKNTKAFSYLCIALTIFSSCQKEISDESLQETTPGQIMNPGFENALTAWQAEPEGGFTISTSAAHSGQYGLKFSAPSAQWSGKIYQTIQDLPDGNYSFKVSAKAVGSGMYLWADGGSGAVTTPIEPAYPDSTYPLPQNALKFTVTGGIAKVGFICIKASPNTAQQPSHILEAEDATINRAAIAANQPGFTGTGFVDFISNSGDFVEWNINRADTGSVLLQFRYANGSTTNRPLKLEVNNIEVNPSLSFFPTGSWTEWATTADTVSLAAGDNKIRLTAIGSNGGNIDNLSWQNFIAVPYFYADDAQLVKEP